ncbi:MAG: EscU/YscU/HrcU family type III secretion system export apparatus switch protein [Candidatus Sulfotelmatobacter sp.]|jgi:flagellar biosynthetic protein FlhB
MADESRTERASPRRRQKAREQGQVARSRDLTSGLGAMTAAVFCAWQMPAFAGDWRGLLRQELEMAAAHPEQFVPVWRNGLAVMRGVALAVGMSWLIATAGGLAQGGLLFAPSALAPNWERFNPVSHVEQLFSLAALSRLLKSLLPTVVIVYLALGVLARDWELFPRLLRGSRTALAGFATSRMFEVAWKGCLVLLVWAGADYFLERQRHENELKMSRQEQKDEFKETEGHPAIKQRVRRLQRQSRRRRMLKDVERAAVVITNPTEFAIALEYRMDMDAPVVVAKGRNLIAEQIKEVARWNGIPIVENVPLAHALYRAVEVGQAIPAQLYTVVAEILAAIWRAQSRATAAEAK